ncbi:MAG TPA: RagB/SusD family nutrient uptake outer membrane protein, partial [Mucilaginibacter sp.]
KYKVTTYASSQDVTEYVMVLRLGEQYLIRSEARAQQGNFTGAQADLDTIRQRAGLASTTASDKAGLLAAILHERQVELFTEWGHRWLDLKRTATINATMDTVCRQKGGTWDSHWQLYPVSAYEIKTDPNLSQTPGYK